MVLRRALNHIENLVNLFLTNTPILYPLKKPENTGFLAFLGITKWEQWLEIG